MADIPHLTALPAGDEADPIPRDEGVRLYSEKWNEARKEYYAQLHRLAEIAPKLTDTSRKKNVHVVRNENKLIQEYAAGARRLARLSQEMTDAVERVVEHETGGPR